MKKDSELFCLVKKDMRQLLIDVCLLMEEVEEILESDEEVEDDHLFIRCHDILQIARDAFNRDPHLLVDTEKS